MELKGSKTEQNLMTAFAGESQARNKYSYYASKAKKDGYEQTDDGKNSVASIKRHQISHHARECQNQA